MIGRPQTSEAASYYSRYIDLVSGDDPVAALSRQLDGDVPFLSGIPEQQSLYRYAPDKWSMREVLGHVNDTERVFAYRALWFARGFEIPLPSFDQNIAIRHANSDSITWTALIDEFRHVRLATLDLFRGLPAEAWSRGGVASDHYVSVRALAYFIAGHAAHHINLLRERYL